MPAVGARDAQRPACLALVPRVADVVVGLVHLGGAHERVGRGAVLAAEAPDVHVPKVDLRLAVHDPLGHHLADAARARQAVRAKAGGHEEPAHLGLAEAELAVGRERLRAVDQLRHIHVGHRRDAQLRVLHDLLEAVPVLFQEPAVEVGRDPVEAGAVMREGPGGAVALIAAHHEPGAVFAEVDEVVGVAQRRQALACETGGPCAPAPRAVRRS